MQALVMKYHNDRALYLAQLDRAEQVLRERFSHDAYAQLVQGMLGGVKS